MPTLTQLKNRNGNAASWTAANPILASGEIGHETDHGRHKIGNGTTAWDELPYVENSLDPRAFGAKGDGVTDDQPAIQAAIEAMAAAGGGDVILPPSATKWRIASPLQMRSHVNLVGFGRRSELFIDPPGGGGMTSRSGWYWCGLYTDYPARLPINDDHPTALIGIVAADEGDLTVTCSTPGDFNLIGAGDWIMLGESAVPGPLGVPKWNTKMQYVKVISRAGDVLTLERSLEWTFNGDSDPTAQFGVARITPIEEAWIKNIAVSCGANALYTFGGGLCCSCGVSDCYIDVPFDPVGRGAQAPGVFDCYAFRFERNILTHGSFGGCGRASHMIVAFNQFLNVNDSAMEIGEAASFCSVIYNKFCFCASSVTAYTVGIGATLHCEVSHNEFFDVPYNVCIACVNGNSQNLRINFNRIIRSTQGGIHVTNSVKTQPIRNVQIIGNYVENVDDTQVGIFVSEYPYCEDVLIAFNDVSKCNTAASYNKINIGSSSIYDDLRTFVVFGNFAGHDTAGAPCLARVNTPFGGGYMRRHWHVDPTAVAQGSFDAATHIASDNRAGLGTPSGWYVVTGGTYGTLVGVTGSINIASKTLTVNDGTSLLRGQYISIVGVSGTKKITWVAGNVVTIDVASDATVVGAAVAFVPPVTVLTPGQGAARGDSVAGDVAALKADFNDLLAKLRSSGVIAP
jgi:hypothetical protein